MSIGTEYSIVPLKCWFILREDLNYSYNRIFNIGIKSIVEPFHNNIRKEWIEDGSKIETYMMFNLSFIESLEELLIKNGILFRWVYDKKTIIGLCIEPTRIYFKGSILNDCLTLEEYARHHITLFKE